MRIAHVISLAALAAGATTQAYGDGFEPHDFNVTKALANLGVPIGKLPEATSNTSALNRRSLVAPCTLAVS